MILVALERHVGDAIVAVVEIDAGRLAGALVQLAELNALAVLSLVAFGALAAEIVPRVATLAVVIARSRSAEIVGHFAFEHRVVVDRDGAERRRKH